MEVLEVRDSVEIVMESESDGASWTGAMVADGGDLQMDLLVGSTSVLAFDGPALSVPLGFNGAVYYDCYFREAPLHSLQIQ